MSFRISLLVAACIVAGASPALAQDDAIQPEPIKVSAHAKAACMPDAMRLCRDAVPNVRNVLMCFGAASRGNQQPLPHRAGELRAAIGDQAFAPSCAISRMNAAGRSNAVNAAANSASARSRSSTGATTRTNFASTSDWLNGRPGSPGTWMTVRSRRRRRGHRDVGRPNPRVRFLRIARREQPLLGAHLDPRHEGLQRRRQRPGRAEVVGPVRIERRDRHLVLHAGQVREAVAGGDAVIDHLEMRRQHRDADPQD